MKPIFYRLISIFILFYFVNLFLFYVVLIEKNYISFNINYVQFFLYSLILVFFILFLLLRTSNYIVKPIENLILYFQSFPNMDSIPKVNSKIQEIQKLSDLTIDFLYQYAKYLEELNLEKNLLNSLLNNLKEGILCINQYGEVIYINDFIKKHFSYGNFHQTRNYFDIIQNPSVLDIIYKIINNKPNEQFFSGKKINDTVFEFKSQNNVYQLKFYLIPKENGNTLRNYSSQSEKLYLFIVNNITEEYNTKRIKEDFLQNASHELKTPITSIRGYAETLLNKKPLQENPVYKNFLERILLNTTRMERIINDMVLISSIESKYYPFHPTEVNINKFLLELNNVSEGILNQKNLKIEYNFANQENIMIADPLLLEHLFLNLIHNSVRYSEENQKIEIHVKEDKDNFIFEVIDYGPGIPDEHKDKIFERFYRIDKDRSRKEGGTGLGLSIVKQIVQLHLGKIQVLDNPKGGSIFCIILPKEIQKKST